MGFFSGVFDWFVGIGIGVLTLVGVSVAGVPTCTMDLSAEQLVWSAEESSQVTITALTNSPQVDGASQEILDAKPFSGDLNQLFAQNPQPILKELQNNGIPNASFDPNASSFIDGFNQSKTVADRICNVYFPESYNTGYSTKNYKSPKDNTILNYNGSSWTQSSANTYPDKGRHIARGPGFSCGRDVDIATLSGTHTFAPALSIGTHTYRLVAEGPNGTKTCEASVTVTDTVPEGTSSNGGSGGTGGTSTAEEGQAGPQCSDGIDNDDDGNVDFPDDLGCTSPADVAEAPNPECSDGIDNNGDGLVDYPEDPMCSSENDFIEEPILPASISLKAKMALVHSGTPTTLTWTAENVLDDSCAVTGSNGDSFTLTGGSGDVVTSGLANETTFVLQCTDLLDEIVTIGTTVRIVPRFQEL